MAEEVIGIRVETTVIVFITWITNCFLHMHVNTHRPVLLSLWAVFNAENHTGQNASDGHHHYAYVNGSLQDSTTEYVECA